MYKLLTRLVALSGVIGVLCFAGIANASVLYSQSIALSPGWNIVSTPKVLDSHVFSAPETSDNFDIYVLDASQPSGWATMAQEGQTEFTPLYGYFIDNKTGVNQTLTFNYLASTTPSQQLFQRTFSKAGWYSFGVANPSYALPVTAGTSTDTNNPSAILNALTVGNTTAYDNTLDFTNGNAATDINSVALADPWKEAISSDVNSLKDFRETKGYGIYITQANALYDGFQNDSATQAPSTPTQPVAVLSAAGNANSIGSQNIAVNVSNQVLGGFTTTVAYEPLSIQGMIFNIASTTGSDALTNIYLVDQNGTVVAGPVNENTSNRTIAFNSTVTLPIGSMTYTLKGTVGPNALNGTTYELSTNPSTQWTGAAGQISGATVTLPNTSIIMSTMTVSVGSLIVSAASTPASTSVVPGANNFVIANINLDASQSGEDVRITSLPIVVNDVNTGTESLANLASALTNCQLYNGSSALNSQAIGGSGWTSTANPLTANFVFQNALTIPKGTVVKLALECNISGSIPNGAVFSAGVNSADAPSATGVESGNSITPTVQTGASGTMTIGSASLAVTNPSPLSYALVSGGTTGVTVGTFTLKPSNDSVNLQNIGLSLNATDASSADISRAYIYNGSTQVGSVIFTGSPINGYYYATSSISSLNLPQNQQTVLTIKADINQIGAGQAGTDGHEILINLADAQGFGTSSGTSVHSGPLSTPQTGIAMYHTIPNIALTSYLPSNGISDGRLIAFTITAGSNGAVGLNQLSFMVSPSLGTTVTNPTLYAYSDSGFSQPVAGTSGGVAGSTSYSSGTAVTTLSTPLEVPAGTTEYFLLKGTVSPSGTSYNVATTLMGDSTNLAPAMYATTGLSSYNFIWSPNSTATQPTTAVDWTNGYAISGLPSIGITQNRTQ